MVRNGSCHCGAVTFTVDLPDPLRGVRCDCSICAMKGAVMVGVPAEALTVTGGEDALASYSFGTGVARHRFCSRCGIHCFHRRRSDPGQYGVNAACLGLNPYHDFPDVAVADGIHHPRDTGTTRIAGWIRFEENPR